MPRGMAKKRKRRSLKPTSLPSIYLLCSSPVHFSFFIGHAAWLTGSWLPDQRLNPKDLVVKTLSLNRWTTRKFPSSAFLISLFVLLLFLLSGFSPPDLKYMVSFHQICGIFSSTISFLTPVGCPTIPFILTLSTWS